MVEKNRLAVCKRHTWWLALIVAAIVAVIFSYYYGNEACCAWIVGAYRHYFEQIQDALTISRHLQNIERIVGSP